MNYCNEGCKLLFVLILLLLSGCDYRANPLREKVTERQEMASSSSKPDSQEIPEYLKRWPGLFIREGDRIIEAPVEDIVVAQKYPEWSDKGAVIDGTRLTIMTEKTSYQIGEEIHVIHVVDVTEPGRDVYIMGPKKVYGEYIDGELVSKPLPEGEDPLIPGLYDGAILASPAVDYNYEITYYTFDEPETHQIHWQLGALRSNTIVIEVK